MSERASNGAGRSAWQRIAAAMVAMMCTVLLPGAVGALAVVGLSSAASAEQTAPHARTPRRLCAGHHHGRNKRCLAHKQRALVKGGSHTSGAPVIHRPSTANTPGSPPAPTTPAVGTTAQPGLPTTPPSEVPAPGGESSTPQGPSHVQVSAKEFSFTLSRPAVAAGPVVIELLNAGQDEHDLHIRPAAGGPDVGAFGIVQPGKHADIEFNLAPGSYTFYCSMPGHEALGMKTTFTVQ